MFIHLLKSQFVVGSEFILGLKNDVGEVTYINGVPFAGSVYDSVIGFKGDLTNVDAKCFRHKDKDTAFEVMKCDEHPKAFACQAIF